MRLVLFIFLLFFSSFSAVNVLAAKGDVVFKGQTKSLVDWRGIDPKTWNDFERWKKHNFTRTSIKNWHQFKREQLLKERVGRVLQCFGKCYVENGDGSSTALFRTSIYETEEFRTEKDSYAWIFMMDGTMVRVSPESSITFKEINIGEKSNFHHARLNYGNVLWLSRYASTLKPTNNRETDVLFLPLEFYDANTKKEEVTLSEENLFAVLEETDQEKNKYLRLNKLISENNKYAINKDTELFLVLPNMTIIGKNASVSAVGLPGGKGYVKSFNSKDINLEDSFDSTVSIHFRGYENYKEEQIDSSAWMEVDPRGREITTASENIAPKLRVSEIPTKRIPSIFIARELLMARYSKFAFMNDISRFDLAKNYGYRKWQKLADNVTELDKRKKFLIEYSRRVETTNLSSIEKLRKQNGLVEGYFGSSVYTVGYFSRAMLAYLKKKDADTQSGDDFKELNSVKKQLWKQMHAIK